MICHGVEGKYLKEVPSVEFNYFTGHSVLQPEKIEQDQREMSFQNW